MNEFPVKCIANNPSMSTDKKWKINDLKINWSEFPTLDSLLTVENCFSSSLNSLQLLISKTANWVSFSFSFIGFYPFLSLNSSL